MKKVLRFFRTYKLFGFALVAAAVALGLDIAGRDTIAHWVLGGAASIAIMPTLWNIWQDIRTGTYGVDILAVTAIGTAVIMREFWAGIVIVLMLSGGEALENYAQRRAKKELSALLNRAPQKAHLIKSRGQIIDVAVSKIEVGDKILIKPGEVVPVDAEIIEGMASFDESSLTGESVPQPKQVKDNLLSGSVSIDGSVTAKALHIAKDSQYAQIIKLVKAASTSQSPFVRLADRYSIPFTIISFAIAGGAWALSGDSLRFLQVLVVATPCPLILAAPIAVISGMSRAAKHGIIIKTGSALERLAEAKTIAFDKTGTLTKGQLTVESVKTYHGFKKADVLSAAASLEQASNHVVAQAIVAAAMKEGAKLAKTKHVKEKSGLGLVGVAGGKNVLVGRLQLLEEHDVELPKIGDGVHRQTRVFVAIDGKLAGVLMLADEIRPESANTIARLKKLGIKNLLMVTGDNATTAKTIAKELGITRVKSEALPADKLIEIENLKDRPVVFVGDGVNDAPVLTVSDVGIALGARGSTAASETADMVILLDDVERVAEATKVAKHTFKIAKQSIFIGIGLSIILMFIFATGKFKPVYGAAVQEVVDVIVIFNALRAHGSFRRKGTKLQASVQQ